MNASSSPDLAETYADVLGGFGIDRSDLDEPHVDEGPLTPETVLWDLELDDPDEAYVTLQQALARSTRGIEAPRRYLNQAPAFQLDDVLEPYGYGVEFEAPGGGKFSAADDAFDVVLRSDGDTERMTFTYPRGSYGEDNYPALVQAVESRLLPREDLTFVLLEGHEDAWRFVLVEESALSGLREGYGRRIEVFGRPLLDADQPADFVDRPGETDPARRSDVARTGLIGGFDAVVAASGIDDAFESIERKAATEPVAPGRDPTPEATEEVDELITSVEGSAGMVSPAVREVSGDRLDEVVDRFEADPTDVEDASARLRPAADEIEEAEGATADEPVEGSRPGDEDEAEPPVEGDGSDADERRPEGTEAGDDRSDGGDDGDGTELRDEHIPSPGKGRPTGLSKQVAEALYSGEEPGSGGGSSARRPDEGEFVAAVDEGPSTADDTDDADDPAGGGDGSGENDGADPDEVGRPAVRGDRRGDDGDAPADPGVVTPDSAGDDSGQEDEPGPLGRLTDTVLDIL